MFKNSFASISKVGRSLQLPIAVLPIAGLLLRFGQPDLLGNPHLFYGNLSFLAAMGQAIFSNMAILFAVGVAIGFAFDGGGAAALAAVVGFYTMMAGTTAFATMLFGAKVAASLNPGVFAGICIGITAGILYNKYHNIKLPEFLAFFGGKRFVPIVTGIVSVLWALFFGYLWPTLQGYIQAFGDWIVHAGAFGFFLYGFVNRILLVFGLHMVLNTYVWFQYGSFVKNGITYNGDISRYFAGDPTAGYFQSGFFLVMMFGLPAACLAMYKTVPKARRPYVMGLYFSIALTAFLTGVTEPIEYSFMFVAPVLYAIHALMTGLAMAITYSLHIRIGFTFSAGAVDFVLNNKFGSAYNWLKILPLGVIYFVAYYIIFYFGVKILDSKVPGREDNFEAVTKSKNDDGSVKTTAYTYIYALGGKENLVQVNNCITRLRLTVKDNKIINEDILKKLGMRGIVRPTPESVQVIIGARAEIVAGEINEYLAGYSTKEGEEAVRKKVGDSFIK
ncbi:MAG: PTS transporter subunit EIIC [Fusobacteria bacterium]|nr:PTS transporter subunit EIIC [Fusobacteriota bacterium]